MPSAPRPSERQPAPGGGRRRIAGYLAGGIGVLLLALSALWWQGESRWGRFVPRTPEQAFADGNFGLELAPLKYILVSSQISGDALGKKWPERFGFIARATTRDAKPCEADAPANLPVGFSVSNRLAGNATPVPVKFVGLTCAACHATAVQKGGAAILGAGSQTADVIAFTDAFLNAVLDTGETDGGGLTAAKILSAYDKQCPGEASGLLGWGQRQLEAFLIDQWLGGFRATARANARKYDLPFHGADLGQPQDIPTGPSRTRPFRSVVRNTLDLPGATNHAYSKVPLAARQGAKSWSQFDGSIGSPVVRSMIAVFTSGASVAALAEPQIVDDIKKAATYTLELGIKPPLPTLAQTFPDRPAPSPESLERGRAIYAADCAGCHGDPGSWKVRAADGKPDPTIVSVGTDRARIDFRYADMLPTALATYLPQRRTDEQQQAIARARSAAFKKGAFAEADWWQQAGEALEERSRRFPAGHPLAFAADEIRKREGYMNGPIDSVWLRAPYLHNASVPSLAALIGLEERPVKFCRSAMPGYDPTWIGLKTVIPDNNACPTDAPFLFDTSMPGNANSGHLYPPPGSRSREELQALLEYLGTL